MSTDFESSVAAEVADLVGAEERARHAATAALSDLAADAFGRDAELLARLLREAGGVSVLVSMLAHSGRSEVKQCALALLGNLLTDVFDQNALDSLALVVSAGGLPRLLELLDDGMPIALYAAAVLQNVTALEPFDVCAELRATGAIDRLRALADHPDPQMAEFATGTIANLRAHE